MKRFVRLKIRKKKEALPQLPTVKDYVDGLLEIAIPAERPCEWCGQRENKIRAYGKFFCCKQAAGKYFTDHFRRKEVSF